MTLTYLLLQASVAVLAITGVLAAARQNMDLLSLVVIGIVTAIGGGTIRDMMLGTQVFWLIDANDVLVAALAATGTFFFEKLFRTNERALLYLDGIAGAVFCVLAILAMMVIAAVRVGAIRCNWVFPDALTYRDSR